MGDAGAFQAGLDMMETLLATGLLLTSASQLRPGDLPVGPGEILLVIWLGLAAMRVTVRLDAAPTTALSRLLLFWAVFIVAECLGTLTAFVLDDVHDRSLFLHDALAYPLVASVSCLSVAGPDAGRRLQRVARIIVPLGAILLLPQIAAGWGFIDFLSISPWYWDRFQGWSSNPNQLALFCAVLAFTALHLADTAERFGNWLCVIACSALFVWVGRLTKADTFTFSLAAGTTVFIIAKLWLWLSMPKSQPTLRPALAVVAVIALPFLLASAIPFAVTAATNSEDAALSLMKNGGKEAAQEADLRLQLWHEAVGRGVDSGFLGLGPGPHLPIPVAVLAGRLSEKDVGVDAHPGVNGTPNFEAHNTPLDLFTQGGLIAVVSFVWLMATAFITACKARLAGRIALLSGVAVFSMTDLIIRQPIFWFGVAFCLLAVEVAPAGVPGPIRRASRYAG